MRSYRLRTKITFFILLSFCTLQFTSLIAVYFSTQHTFSSVIDKQLVNASGLIQNQIQSILDERARQVQRLAADNTFKQSLKNKENLEHSFNSINLRLEHTKIIVLDHLGKVLQTSTPLERPYLDSFSNLFPSKLVSEETSSFPKEGKISETMRLGVEVINGQIWGCLGSPVIENNEHLGWLVVALPIDNVLASSLKGLSGVGYELSFILQNAKQGWESFASSDPLLTPDINYFLRHEPAYPSGSFKLTLNNDSYLNLMIPLTQTLTGVDVALMLHYNLEAAMAPFNPIVWGLLGSILLALLLGLIGARTLSTRISQPLSRLLEGIEHVKQGHYEPIELSNDNDEFSALAEHFNEMAQTIKAQEEHSRFKLTKDPITSLDNRNSFIEKTSPYLTQDRANGQGCLVLIIRIDNYNAVTSTMGQTIGNDMMRSCAKQLTDRFKHDCIIARIDNEKLGLFVSNISQTSVFTFSEMVMRVLDSPFLQDTMIIDTIPAIGVAAYPQDGNSIEELMQHAEIALFSAPKTYDRIAYYQTGQDYQTKLQLSLMSELRKGMLEGEITLAFQPKINLRSNIMTGVESLIRWNHPKRGQINPADFIPMAEHTGQILQLSQWILNQTIAQLAIWQRQGYQFSVAVNLSAKDLQSRNLASLLDYAVREAGVPHERLILEITESYIMHDPKNAIDLLSTLNHMHFKLAIDDFGTGHSSLAYLKNLPVNELKIDMSYIKDLKDDAKNQSIVQAIIMVAQNLDLQVTAEGIEDEYCHKMLLDFGCDTGQGYYYCAPLPLETFNQWLKESPYSVPPKEI